MNEQFVKFSRRLSGVSNALSTAGAVLAGIIFMGMVLLVVTDVVMRNLFSASTLIATEYSGYALAAMTYLSLAFTFREGAHIRITFIQGRLPKRLRRPAELILVAMAMFVVGVAVLSVWEMVSTSWGRGTIAYTVARTPLYIPQATILVGLALLLLQLVSYFVAVAISGEAMMKLTEDEAPVPA